jgi:glutathione S-transferase
MLSTTLANLCKQFMPTLYGTSGSRAARNLWLLEELAIPYEHKPVSFLNKGTRTPEMLALNASGQIPVLTDGDLTLCESLAINFYLTKKYPSPLSAQNLNEEATAMQWSFWAVTACEKEALTVLMHSMFLPEEQRKAEMMQQAAENLRKPLAVLEQYLHNKNYLMAERFTVADLNVASILNWARPAKAMLADYPKVSDWLNNCLARPAQKKVRTLP